MYRMIEENFLKWKKQENHKPLLISGSRQVGKTYSILNFAKKHYLSYVYINLKEMMISELFLNRHRNRKKS